jgi:hypothetical protein
MICVAWVADAMPELHIIIIIIIIFEGNGILH